MSEVPKMKSLPQARNTVLCKQSLQAVSGPTMSTEKSLRYLPPKLPQNMHIKEPEIWITKDQINEAKMGTVPYF